MSTEFKPGDKVWFTSKFGDRVTGTYHEDRDVPGINGTVRVHIVWSCNAFGRPTAEPISCMVPLGKLKRDTE